MPRSPAPSRARTHSTFYTALGKEMLKFPPPAADRPLLAQLQAVGIGPGLNPANAHLSADTLRGLRDAVTQGPSKVLSPPRWRSTCRGSPSTTATSSPISATGAPNYALRAIGDQLGVGGQRASIATYPFALFDDTKAPLTGSKRYVLHIPQEQPPIR